jgi:hypothetical protein
MNLHKQMGLFSELLCLRDIILPRYGVEQAINNGTLSLNNCLTDEI